MLEKRPFAYAVLHPDGAALKLFFQEAAAVDYTALEEGRSYIGLYRREPPSTIEQYHGLIDEMAETLRPVKTEQDIAALAERLAKVEDRLAGPRPADNYGSILTRLDALEEKHENLWTRFNANVENVTTDRLRGDRLRDKIDQLHDRIDGVATIFGDRVAELGEEIGKAFAQLAELREMFDKAETRTVNVLDSHSAMLAGLAHPDAPAFPTGGALTAEAAAEAVLPVPQRGDRVRLEGALTTRGTPIKNGWYEVVGVDPNYLTPASRAVQIRVPQIGVEGGWLPWLYLNQAGFKEVRQHPFTKETDNVVD